MSTCLAYAEQLLPIYFRFHDGAGVGAVTLESTIPEPGRRDPDAVDTYTVREVGTFSGIALHFFGEVCITRPSFGLFGSIW